MAGRGRAVQRRRSAGRGQPERRRCGPQERQRPDLPLVTEAVLAWIDHRDAIVSLRTACVALSRLGHRHWDVSRLLRKSPLFKPTRVDPSLPEEFRTTEFRLTTQGQNLWEDLHARGPARIPAASV